VTHPIIQIDGIGKRYRIGAGPRRADRTFRDALAALPRRSIARLRGAHTMTEEFWALRDITLEIEQGDVVGLVGRNGAGKSTLLKILSRIVEPTAGRAVLDGRVSSLLEVGSGFHIELTGRENIYLNGAILGMRRREIQAKFDEIVEFSEVEKFLDTPIKFYSSGMYVRLAFAVAAHLEPDILIVDEVLAVGDLQFQKKSLGKMSSVARAGRTVIFVSHNMGAVLDLCDHGVLLEEGRLKRVGSIQDVVAEYVRPKVESGRGRFERAGLDPTTHVLTAVALHDETGETKEAFDYGDVLRIRLETNDASDGDFGLELRIKDSLHQPVAYASSWIGSAVRFRPGDTIEITIPALFFAEDTYYLDFVCRVPRVRVLDEWWDGASFSVVNASPGLSPVNIIASDQVGAIVLEDAVFTTH
jgi:lipopolysaccharide transport system ATP-binding protein